MAGCRITVPVAALGQRIAKFEVLLIAEMGKFREADVAFSDKEGYLPTDRFQTRCTRLCSEKA